MLSEDQSTINIEIDIKNKIEITDIIISVESNVSKDNNRYIDIYIPNIYKLTCPNNVNIKHSLSSKLDRQYQIKRNSLAVKIRDLKAKEIDRLMILSFF
jgi:uncharacterized alkaline shock family protein YloU